MLNEAKVFFHLQRIISGNYSRMRQVLADEVHLHENDNILDLACGTGNISDSFGTANYVGVDLDQDYLRFAKAQFKKEFLVADARQLCFGNGSFNWVIAMGLFHHLSDADTLCTMGEVRKVLSREGQVVVIDAIPPVSKLNILGLILRKLDRGKHIRYLDQYERLFSKHFSIKRAYHSGGWLLNYCVFVLDLEPVQ